VGLAPSRPLRALAPIGTGPLSPRQKICSRKKKGKEKAKRDPRIVLSNKTKQQKENEMGHLWIRELIKRSNQAMRQQSRVSAPRMANCLPFHRTKDGLRFSIVLGFP
jgi:hypothetical protein